MRFFHVITWCVWDGRTAYTRGNSQILEEVKISLFVKKEKKNKRKEMQSVKVLLLINFCNVHGHLIRETLLEKSIVLHTFFKILKFLLWH